MHFLNKSKQELIAEIHHLHNELNQLRAKAHAPTQPRDLINFSYTTPANAIDNEENFKYLVEAINEVVYKIDAQGKIMYVSPNIEKIFGYKSTEMIGNHIVDYLGSSNKDIVLERYNKLAVTGISLSEYLVPVQNNKEVWIRLSTKAIFENNTFIGAYGTLIDISDRKLMEIALAKSEANARTILESSPDMIFLISKDGYIIDTNEIHANRLGMTKDELIGKNVFEYFPPEAVSRRKNFLQEAINKKTLIKKEDFREGKWYESNILPIILDNNEIEHLIIYAKDITERKNSELVLKQNEIKLRELVATKDKFFSIISHDLRSPFNAILGFSELLNENLSQQNYEDLEMYAGIIQKSAKHAYDLLQNLLNWSRTQLGTIPYNPVKINLIELIEYGIELTKEQRIQKQQSLLFNTNYSNIIIHADKEMMISIICNLLSNANKYTKVGGTISIHLETESSKVSVSVIDTGVGMSKTDVLKLFKIEHSFSTPGTNKEVGTGLGLILCKEFIKKNHGKIWAESTEGQGSKFTFSIPTTENIE